MMIREKDCDRFLLVEGYSDLLFVAELLEHLGIGRQEGGEARPCFVKEFQGKSDLLDQLEVWFTPLRLRKAKAIGIVLDADTSAVATRQSLVDRLGRVVGMELPVDGGWVQHPEGARIGFHVVPGAEADDQGEIETLVWRSLQERQDLQPRVQCVESFLACVEGTGVTLRKRDKARVSALLAAIHSDDPRLGPGARAKCFDFGANSLGPLRRFLLGMKGS
jgi:hypothetical protein